MKSPPHRPAILPEQITTRDWLLRRWSHDDAQASLAAVNESFEQLHRWMPWAAELPTLSHQQEYLASARRRWDVGEAFEYGIFSTVTKELVGTVGLHARVGPRAWDIGYWVHTRHTRRGVATLASSVLTDAALNLPDTDRVEIHCDQANTASAAIPRRLGYRLDRVENKQPDAPAKCGRRMIWVMTRAAFSGSETERHARAAHGHRQP